MSLSLGCSTINIILEGESQYFVFPPSIQIKGTQKAAEETDTIFFPLNKAQQIDNMKNTKCQRVTNSHGLI